MRWRISPHFQLWHGSDLEHHAKGHHDPRTMDLIAIVALLIFVIGSGWYLAASFATAPSTTAFIVPSQSVHW